MFKGERLKMLRKAKGLKQQDLADMLGITKSAISLYENGKRQPSYEHMIDFICIFACDADYLLGTEIRVKNFKNDERQIITMTKEEILFIEELKKDKFVYNILLEDPRRGAELVKTRIG